MRWLDGITAMDVSLEQAPGDGEGQGTLVVLQSMGWQRAGHDLVTEQQCVFLHHVIYHTKLSRGDRGTYTTAVAGGPFKHSGSGYLFYM